MGGGWVGYVFVFAGCGLLLVIAGASTAILYGVARAKAKSEPRVSVVAFDSNSGEEPDVG